MFTTLIQTVSSLFSSLAGLVAPAAELDDVTHLLEEAAVAEKPLLHTGPSPFARWVDELDDEVTEAISGQRVDQLLLRAEHKAARKASRRTAPQMVQLNTRYAFSA